MNGKELAELGANSAGAAIGIAAGEALGSWVEFLIKPTATNKKVNERVAVKILTKIGLGLGMHGASVIPGMPLDAEPWLDSIAAGSIGSVALDLASLVLKVSAGKVVTLPAGASFPSSAIESAIFKSELETEATE